MVLMVRIRHFAILLASSSGTWLYFRCVSFCRVSSAPFRFAAHLLTPSRHPQVTQTLTDVTDVLSLNGAQVKVSVKLAGPDIIPGLKVSGPGHCRVMRNMSEQWQVTARAGKWHSQFEEFI